MGETSYPRSTDEDVGMWISCWGRFMLELPWKKRRMWRDTERQGKLCSNLGAFFTAKHPKPAGGFKYDPLSYAQNFDEGSWDEGDANSLSRGFSSRYAASSKSRMLESGELAS